MKDIAPAKPAFANGRFPDSAPYASKKSPASQKTHRATPGRKSGASLRQSRDLRGVALAVGVGLVIVLMAAIPVKGTAADLEAGRRKAEPCAACHGPDGNANIPGTPSLAGQPVYFTHWQLIKFRDGRRKDPQMSPLAQNLSDADMADLAAYYEAQQPRPRPASTDPTRIAAGQRLAELHHCASCHRPGFTGQQQVPRLAGQDYAYLLKLLRGFKARTASDLDGTMTIAAQPLTDEDILNLVHFLASLGTQP